MIWEGEYVYIFMLLKWFVAFLKEVFRRILFIVVEGEKKSEVIVVWEGYMRVL